MNSPAQIALPKWLKSRAEIQKQILQRISENTNTIKDSKLEMLRIDAGWSVIIRLPRLGTGADNLLSLSDVVVHPGSIYGIAADERIVVSLIGNADEFSTGIARIAKIMN